MSRVPGDDAADNGFPPLTAQTGTMTAGRQIRRESERVLAEQGVAIPDAIRFATRKPPCAHGPLVERVRLATNMWALSQQRKTIYVYDVEFRGIRALQGDQGEQVVRFTKRNDDAMIILDRRDKVRAIFGGLVRKHHAFFAGPVFCDLQCTVFTTTDLPLERLTEDEKTTKGRAARKFDDLTLDEVHPRELFSSDFVRFEASFKRLRGRRELELGNLERYATNANPLHVDRTLIQFLELATSHYIFMESQAYATYGSGQSYLMAPIEHGFTPTDILMSDDGDNLLDPSNTAYLAIGMHKSVRLIAGPANGGLCALTVETKQSAFHVPGPLLEKVASAAAPATVESITTNFHLLWSLNLKYRGTRVVIASNSAVNPLGGRKCLEFMQFVTATSHTHFFLFEGRRISLYDHLRTQYAYVVSRPNAPLVQVKERRRTVHYPIELLEVADAQRIRMSQADPMLVRNTTRACALEPRKLFSHTLKNLEALNPDNPDLVALGLDVRGPIEIVGSIHTPPMIQYANKQVSVHRGKWCTTGARFYKPVDFCKWAVVRIGARCHRFTEEHFAQFVEAFMDAALLRGITLCEPERHHIPDDPLGFKAKLSELADRGVGYILFVRTQNDRYSHDLMKWAETHYGFITQDTGLHACLNVVRGKTHTTENIVSKANVKLGGLNYTLALNDVNTAEILDDVLYIGYGVQDALRNSYVNPDDDEESDLEDAEDHFGRDASQGHTRRIVIGISANCNEEPFEFVGDFMFGSVQSGGHVAALGTVVDRCLILYHRHRQGRTPKRIVLFRSGCSEGQFANILKYDVPLVRHRIAELFGSEPARLTVIVPNKRHNVRVFKSPIPTGGASEQHVEPGTAVDHTVTSVNLCEFYLNAQACHKGTAKVPRYTVLYDENDLALECLQRMVYWLCHGNQVVAQATSLPAPVCIANEYAKRGRNIYKSVTTHGDALRDNGDVYKGMSPDELNRTLTYWHGCGELCMSFRLNA